jgi:cyclohexa-1,5-dienecarbonyl-CoA hydratase
MTLKTNRDGGVATLTLDRPPLNVLTRALTRELRAALASLAADPSLRALVLAAEGKHFSAGADVGEHLPPSYKKMIPEFVETLEELASFPLPVVAAVRGRCLGGGFELAQCADVIVAGEGATFGQPEIVLGVTAPIACVLLPRRASPGLANELLFGGDSISALRAQAAGLVQRVVHDDQVESEAHALAQRFARHSAAALRLTKKTLLAAADRPRHDALRQASSVYLNDLMTTEDALEGLTAFVEKRTPAWRNR